MKPLKLMILCGRSPRHLYVANALCRAGDPVAIVQETGGDWSLRALLKKLKPIPLTRKLWRWLRDRQRYSNRQEASFFFPQGAPTLDRPDLVRSVSHINQPDVVRWLAELEPDLVCVFGTSLIRGALLRGGREGIINLHGGLSPEYRGADCTFWALYNDEPNKVGCTLHYINAGIDTGELIAHVCPEVLAEDLELPLFWRAVQRSADVYAELVQRIARGEKFGTRQVQKGRLYQIKDRGLRQERELARRLARGLPPLPLRVRWFPAESSQ